MVVEVVDIGRVGGCREGWMVCGWVLAAHLLAKQAKKVLSSATVALPSRTCKRREPTKRSKRKKVVSAWIRSLRLRLIRPVKTKEKKAFSSLFFLSEKCVRGSFSFVQTRRNDNGNKKVVVVRCCCCCCCVEVDGRGRRGRG